MHKTIATLVAPFLSAMLEALTYQYMVNVEAREDRHETSALLLAQIIALRGKCADVAEYLSACVALFGNGKKGKDREAGALSAQLAAHGMDPRVVSAQLTMARAVAFHVADAAVFEQASKPDATMRPLYQAALKARQPAPAPQIVDSAGASVAATLKFAPDMPADLLQQVIAKIGVARVLRETAAILKASKATDLEGRTIESVAAKFK